MHRSLPISAVFSHMGADIDAQILLLVKNSKSLARIPCHDFGKLLCKCAFETILVMTKESFYPKFQQHGIFCPGKIDGIAVISAMKAAACRATCRASCQLDGAFQPKPDLVILDADLSDLEPTDIQKEQAKIMCVHVQV